jgi:hypothetical protein
MGWGGGPGMAMDAGPQSSVESTIARSVRRQFCRAERLRSLTGRRIIRSRYLKPRLRGRGLLHAGVLLKDLAKLALTLANDLQEVPR